MNKKHLFIAAALLLTITLVVLLFVARAAQNDRTADPADVDRVLFEDERIDEASGDSRVARLSASPVFAFTTTETGVVFFSRNNEVVYTTHEGGVVRGPERIGNEDVVMTRTSPTGDIAMLIEERGGRNSWLLFREDSGQFEILPANTRDVLFAPSGTTLAVVGDRTESALVIQTEGNRTTIGSFSIPDLTATWVNDTTVALGTRPSGEAPGIAYLYTTTNRATTRLLGGRRGLTFLVSPTERFVLFSQSRRNGRDVSFRMLDRNTEEEFSLALSTLPEKCVFAQDDLFAYCAVFEEDVSQQYMPDNYYKGVFRSTQNTLVRIDLETGESIEIARQLPFDMTSLQLTPEENTIIFINKNDGALYRLSL